MSLIAAFFDVDGTLIKGNAIQHYLYFAQQNRLPSSRWRVAVPIICKLPCYLLIDKLNRGLFNHVFYREYRNMSVRHVDQNKQKYFSEKLVHSIFPEAQARINFHKQKGHKIIFVSGALDFIVEPLANFLGADMVLATHLKIEGGCYTGTITNSNLIGQKKAAAIEDIARILEINLCNSFAYGDSVSDIPMLNTVFNPVAINPDYFLLRMAKKSGWSINYWKLSGSTALIN